MGMENREISQAVIVRLPRYRRYLGELKKQGIERISSKELSRIMHVTASQIRQDFNNFGGFGQQGYGYNISYLHEEIGKILGLDKSHTMLLVGAGHLGSALINYMKFRTRGFNFVAAFDISPEVYGRSIGGIEVLPMKELAGFLEKNQVDIAVLTLPKEAAVEAAEVLTRGGCRAIWNFAHVDLMVPASVVVENVHLSDSLYKLSYNIKRRELSETE